MLMYLDNVPQQVGNIPPYGVQLMIFMTETLHSIPTTVHSRVCCAVVQGQNVNLTIKVIVVCV